VVCPRTHTANNEEIGATLDCDDDNKDIYPGAVEFCDNVDNNCFNGKDEGCDDDNDAYCGCLLDIVVGSNLSETCSKTDTSGVSAIADTCDCDEAKNTVNPSADEECDNIDNNCNGARDEGCICTIGAEQSCGIDIGACNYGLQTCVASGWSTTCIGEVTPLPEICDGIDNNCDGIKDEGCDVDGDGYCRCSLNIVIDSDLSEACLKTDTSDVNTIADTCDCDDTEGANAINPDANEICDGIDNNCNNTIEDEKLLVGPPVDNLKLGSVCEDMTKKCIIGNWQNDYVGNINYQYVEKKCDGLDNDCDGIIDEGCICINGSTQNFGPEEGECLQGTKTCVDGDWVITTPEVASIPEDCNGKDDDCDGTVDNNLPNILVDNQLGVCAGNFKKCFTGGWDNDYANIPGNEYPDEISCDGKDNNCNGTVDEDFFPELCQFKCEGSSWKWCATDPNYCCGNDVGESFVPNNEYDNNPIRCHDGIDNDCDCLKDEADPDCAGVSGCIFPITFPCEF
jgi:hypothetical protein